MQINVMIDLETWGTRAGSALRSIGAVAFDAHSDQMGSVFYRNISDESCIYAGLMMDQSTIKWWSQQTEAAQKALLTDQRSLEEVVDDFHNWFKTVSGVFIWSHGANFDEPLWSEAVKRIDRSVPWRFWDVRCTRTLYDVTGFNPKTMRRFGTHHNALDDAVHQARCVQAAYRYLNSQRDNEGVDL